MVGEGEEDDICGGLFDHIDDLLPFPLHHLHIADLLPAGAAENWAAADFSLISSDDPVANLVLPTGSPVSVLEGSSVAGAGDAEPNRDPSKRRRRPPAPLISNLDLLPGAKKYKRRRATTSKSAAVGSSSVAVSVWATRRRRHKKDHVAVKVSSSSSAVTRCTHCETTSTLRWRTGPLGPKTLCNACGLRFNSGRLFPEYRPLASPTFIPALHSNFHKKVEKMRLNSNTGEKASAPAVAVSVWADHVAVEVSSSSSAVTRCTHCEATRTLQWRTGPLGPRTLCNACGLRFKSGGLFPEYRPSASPTFVAALHSNFHKKVEKMRLNNTDTGEKAPAAAVAVSVWADHVSSSLAVTKCTHCETTRTFQWRTGPLGPRTLCNACGLRFNSGGLAPEYRPSASPMFIAALHSDFHKVEKMRLNSNTGEKAPAPAVAVSAWADHVAVEVSSSSSAVTTCTHCETTRTFQWRTGPLGPRTLCNACGLRFNSGGLVPEYRPSASPMFIAALHSNFHKKEEKMRLNSNTGTDVFVDMKMNTGADSNSELIQQA